MVAPIRFLLVTEDSGSQAIPTIERIARKMLLWIDGTIDPDRAEWLPGAHSRFVDPLVLAAQRGWKALNHRELVELRQFLATKLVAAAPRTFVILHADGDARWADSAGGTTGPGVQDLHRRLREPLTRLLREHNHDALVQHVLCIVPFYCIEAWLYQNTTELRRIYAQRFQRHRTLRLLDDWEAEPGLLDEIADPKEILAPVGNGYNVQLAEGLPMRKAVGAGKSLHATVEQFLVCDPLVVSLLELRR